MRKQDWGNKQTKRQLCLNEITETSLKWQRCNNCRNKGRLFQSKGAITLK